MHVSKALLSWKGHTNNLISKTYFPHSLPQLHALLSQKVFAQLLVLGLSQDWH